MRYRRIIEAVTHAPWAIMPAKLSLIREVLAIHNAGIKFSEGEIRERLGEPNADDLGGPELFAANGVRAAGAGATVAGGNAVAVLQVHGTICHRIGEMGSGGCSTEMLQAGVEQAAANPDVGSILLDFNSPGGAVNGVAELADAVMRARESKRVVAMVNSLAASAAYWVATQADEIVVTADGDVGSIGVWTMHQDISGMLEKEGVDVTLIFAGKHKVDGHAFGPLPDDVRAELQGRVDAAHETFLAAVARGRGVGVGQVREGFGQGRVIAADEAIELGMADRIGTMRELIGELIGEDGAPQGGSGVSASRRRAQGRMRLMGRLYGGATA